MCATNETDLTLIQGRVAIAKLFFDLIECMFCNSVIVYFWIAVETLRQLNMRESNELYLWLDNSHCDTRAEAVNAKDCVALPSEYNFTDMHCQFLKVWACCEWIDLHY